MSERNAWIASALVLILAVVGIPLLRTSSTSLGDWGDYVGAVVTTITLIWLVVAHHQGQEDLAETNKQVERQAELNAEILQALNRIANSATLDAHAKTATQQPQFVSTDNTFQAGGFRRGEYVDLQRSKAPAITSGSITFRNDGGGCRLVSIDSLNPDITVNVNPVACASKSTFSVDINSQIRLNSQQFEFKLNYDDLFGTRRSASVRIENLVVVDIQIDRTVSPT